MYFFNIVILILLFFVNAQGASPSFTNCHFYLDKEKETGCWFQKKDSSDYLIKYGYKYCSTFNLKARTWNDERTAWVKNTAYCLQNELEHNSKNISCKRLEHKAYSLHSVCYLRSNFCNLSVSQMISILRTAIGLDVLLKPQSSFYQGFKIFSSCLNSKSEFINQLNELYELSMQVSAYSDQYQSLVLQTLEREDDNPDSQILNIKNNIEDINQLKAKQRLNQK